LEECIASIIRVERTSQIATTSAVTINLLVTTNVVAS
jgi:hypothetical protein